MKRKHAELNCEKLANEAPLSSLDSRTTQCVFIGRQDCRSVVTWAKVSFSARIPIFTSMFLTVSISQYQMPLYQDTANIHHSLPASDRHNETRGNSVQVA